MTRSRPPDRGTVATPWADTSAVVALRTGLADSALPDDSDCSPHPLDVLAIYALYQQESSP
ncbi:MAG: hypothetical protein OXP73_07835 [Chloroflexota bacterium]|nr:hypothetical protein [Chloroflexota bacterium]